uniref:Uncharacterized protein n=1 Tax=Anguilla anguilla TaxID=7936 RepID=A0A0E9Q0P0_ANGAN
MPEVSVVWCDFKHEDLTKMHQCHKHLTPNSCCHTL